jgi:uncharacterized membrane protein YcgQ (UPF0703/DUF1980 family)
MVRNIKYGARFSKSSQQITLTNTAEENTLHNMDEILNYVQNYGGKNIQLNQL